MASDAMSILVSLTTATNSNNTTATPLNLLTGSGEYGYNVTFYFKQITNTTAPTGANVTTIIPTIYKSADGTTWYVADQGRPFTASTATSGTASYAGYDMRVRSGHDVPYIAAGFVASIGSPGGLSVIYQAAITTGREVTG